MEIHKIVCMFLTPSKSQVPFPALFCSGYLALGNKDYDLDFIGYCCFDLRLLDNKMPYLLNLGI